MQMTYTDTVIWCYMYFYQTFVNFLIKWIELLNIDGVISTSDPIHTNI